MEITNLVPPKHSLGEDPLDKRIGHTIVQFKTGHNWQHDDDQDEMYGLTTLHSDIEEKMTWHGEDALRWKARLMDDVQAEDFEDINELPRPPHCQLPVAPAIRRKPLP